MFGYGIVDMKFIFCKKEMECISSALDYYYEMLTKKEMHKLYGDTLEYSDILNCFCNLKEQFSEVLGKSDE